jgi:chemotaxis signal transduction protein
MPGRTRERVIDNRGLLTELEHNAGAARQEATAATPAVSVASAGSTAASVASYERLAPPEGPRSLRERMEARAGTAELLLFRVGHELFAAALAVIEEAVELPDVHHLPETSKAMLGVFISRGRMLPIYSPAGALGVPLSAATAALVVRAGNRCIGVAVDDVEDVFEVDLSTVRASPGIDDADGVLLGVTRRGSDLVAVIDTDALITACLSDRLLENA